MPIRVWEVVLVFGLVYPQLILAACASIYLNYCAYHTAVHSCSAFVTHTECTPIAGGASR